MNTFLAGRLLIDCYPSCKPRWRRSILVFLVALAMVSAPLATQRAVADEPVTIGIGGWLAITAGAAAVTWGVNKLLDSTTAKKPPKQKTTRTRNVRIRKPDGTIIVIQEQVQIDPPLSDVMPLAMMTVPADWLPAPILAGDRTMGTFIAEVDSILEELIQHESADVSVGTSVVDLVDAEGGVSGTDDWEMAVTIDGYFKRPDDPGAMDATLGFAPTGSVMLTTTDLPGTIGTASYQYRVTADQLGGVIFEGGVEIDQGSEEFRLINGGIPGATYNVVGPGLLEVIFDGVPLEFPVPNEVDFIDFSVDTLFGGSAELFPDKGDMNGDGVIDGFDVGPFVFLLTNGVEAYQLAFPDNPDPQFVADINMDGEIDGFDVDPLIQILTGAGVAHHGLESLRIPEPGTVSLFLLGLLGALFIPRRLRQQK